jgi:hypothetical protein
MTTTATTEDITALIAGLTEMQLALGDPRDQLSENAQADCASRLRTVALTISGLRNLPDDLAREQSRLDDLEARRAAVVAEFARLETLLADARDWRTIPNARERDAEYDRQRDLRRAHERLGEGTLLKSPTETYERLSDLDRRIAEIRARRDGARRALDAHLKAAAELLS